MMWNIFTEIFKEDMHIVWIIYSEYGINSHDLTVMNVIVGYNEIIDYNEQLPFY